MSGLVEGATGEVDDGWVVGRRARWVVYAIHT